MESVQQLAIEVAAEADYGVDPGGGEQLPALNDAAFWQMAMDTQASQAVGQSPRTRPVAFPQADIPVLTLPLVTGRPRAALFEAAGWRLVGGRWVPSRHGGSVTIRAYHGGRRWVFGGCRGRWELEARAGEPIVERYALTGRYADPLVRTLPETTWAPFDPELACNLRCTIEHARSGLKAVEPGGPAALRGLTLQSGATVQLQTAARRDGQLHAVKITQVEPRWRFTVEDWRGADWQRAWRDQDPWHIGLTVGATAGAATRYRTCGASAVLVEAPQVTQESGFAFVDLVFGFTGRAEDAIEAVPQ